MMLMIIAILAVLGLCLGSFVNALVWRLHEQEQQRESVKPNKKYQAKLSISRGRSMCPHCKHELAAKDLIPVLSWIGLGGKCRYCGKSISIQYPAVELKTAVIFVLSYIYWPAHFTPPQTVLFIIWLVMLVILIALLVYDLHWFLLPNNLMYPLAGLAAVFALITIAMAHHPAAALLGVLLATLVGGGLFYLLFQVSDGKWIGGGDVKLGGVLGLIVGTPVRSFLVIFFASLLGSLVSVPLLANRRLKRTSMIPFGPFLIVAAIIVQLFGTDILQWYRTTFINF